MSLPDDQRPIPQDHPQFLSFLRAFLVGLGFREDAVESDVSLRDSLSYGKIALVSGFLDFADRADRLGFDLRPSPFADRAARGGMGEVEIGAAQGDDLQQPGQFVLVARNPFAHCLASLLWREGSREPGALSTKGAGDV